jgi:hypothetical protein
VRHVFPGGQQERRTCHNYTQQGAGKKKPPLAGQALMMSAAHVLLPHVVTSFPDGTAIVMNMEIEQGK